MTRRELVLQKLHELSDSEINEAIRQLTRHVCARLRLGSLIDRTKSGAHSSNNLGMDAVDYYVGESFRRLYEPDGWEWQFEKYSFVEQLMRIANHLISWKVSAYKKSKDNLPEFDDRDAGDIYELSETSDCPDDVTEDTVTELTRLAYEVSKDDDNLSYFTMRYFEKADFKTIALEMGLSVEQVYVLRKKLVRRLLPFKNELID
jgi:hypothetical protein